jgi:hypothetical protein
MDLGRGDNGVRSLGNLIQSFTTPIPNLNTRRTVYLPGNYGMGLSMIGVGCCLN